MVLNYAGETRKRDVTTMFTYSHANTPLGQSERAYYLSYFIKYYVIDVAGLSHTGILLTFLIIKYVHLQQEFLSFPETHVDAR